MHDANRNWIYVWIEIFRLACTVRRHARGWISGENLTLGARANGGDDFITISDPDEWLWVFVVLSEEAVDGGLKVDE